MLPEHLTIKELIYLLSIKDKTGKAPLKHDGYHYGVIGGALLELTMRESVEVREKKLILKKNETTNDQSLDYIINKLGKRKKPRKVKDWVSDFCDHFKKIRDPIRDSLYEKDYLQSVDKRFLGFKLYTLYPVIKTQEKQDIANYLHDIILEKENYSDKDGAIISMLYLTGVFHSLFPDKKERKQARNKIKKQIKEGLISSAVNESIKEMQTAMIVAVTAASAAGAAAGASSS